jgi:hypothetical protein
MEWTQYISWYLLIGVSNLAIIDWTHYKMIELGLDAEPYNNVERIVIGLLWPLYATVFWVIFFKNLFTRKND